MLSIIIPTLNASSFLGPTLDALAEAPAGTCEVIVVDGGSEDGTLALVAAKGARLVVSDAGRGVQLGAGAEAARGDWLLFLHADTVPSPGWCRAVDRFRADSANGSRAACFRFALDDCAPAARRLEAMVAWRCRRLGLAYGDQGLLIARVFYHALGGYRPLPLMEDVCLIRRVGRSRLAMLDASAATSSARFAGGGYWRRSLRNLACLTLYIAGVEPRLIARLYG